MVSPSLYWISQPVPSVNTSVVHVHRTFGAICRLPHASSRCSCLDLSRRRDLDKRLARNHIGGSLKTVNQQTNFTADYNFPTVGLGGTTFASSLGTAAATNALRPTSLLNTTTTRNAYDSALTFLLGSIPSVTTLFNYNTGGTTLPLTTGRNRDWRYVEYEFYAGDNWKVRNDLSLTFGVRWHIYPAPYEVKGFQSIQNVDFETLFNQRVQNAAQGIATASSEPFLVYNLGGKGNNARPFYDTEYNNFGPRLSFAWNPSVRSGLLAKLFGDRKTVIRGGGTVTYDRPGGGITFLQDQNTYIFDTSITNNFAATNGAVALATFPRFTSINSVPVQNVAPPVSVPFHSKSNERCGNRKSDSETRTMQWIPTSGFHTRSSTASASNVNCLATSFLKLLMWAGRDDNCSRSRMLVKF